MTVSPSDVAKPLSQKALRLLASYLAGTLKRVEQELSDLRPHNQALREGSSDFVSTIVTCAPAIRP
jgi:hypothetical protein